LNLSENEALLPLLAAGERYRSETTSTHSIPIPSLYVVGLLHFVYQASFSLFRVFQTLARLLH